MQKLTPQQLKHLGRVVSTGSPDVSPDSPILRHLQSLDRRLLDELMTEQHYEAGEIVFKEGDRGDAMYLIRSGLAAVVKGNLESPTVLAYRQPGVIIGEMALLDDRPRSASVVALTELRLLKISREGFQTLLSHAPTIGTDIMATLSARLRESDRARDLEVHVGKQLGERVSELQSEKQQLLEIQRLRQELSYFIIHDLRNPLGAMHNAISVLGMVLPKDVLQDNQDLFYVAKSSSERMQRLVDSLLDVAKLEADEAQLSLASVSARRLVERTVNQVKTMLEVLGNITVEAITPADLPFVMIDEEKIERVLGNLVDNATKYTPKGGKITVTAELQNGYVLVSVTDTGPGIPPEQRERIFERFAQVTGDRRGFGLGLAFCKLMVEAHGGRIWVEPGEGGVGSRFVFSLPYT